MPDRHLPVRPDLEHLGRDRIVAMLRDLGAADLQHAFDRACLQGRLDTARQLYAMGARPGVVNILKDELVLDVRRACARQGRVSP